MRKRGQVTIFIILGVIIVAAAAVAIIVLASRGVIIRKASSSNPESFLATCLADDVKQGIKILEERGGSTDNPLKVGFKFDDSQPTNISYLCYSEVNNEPCVEEQVLFPYFETNLARYLGDDIQTCFGQLVDNIKKQGYEVQGSYKSSNVSIQTNKVDVNINVEMTLTKSATQRYTSFKISVPSQIHGLLQTTQEILNVVAAKCTFNGNFNAVDYPDYDINSYPTIKESTIYTIQNRQTKDQFNFAARCTTSLNG